MPTVQKLSSRLAWKQGITGESLKDKQQKSHKLSNRQKHKYADTITNQAPLIAEKTNVKTESATGTCASR